MTPSPTTGDSDPSALRSCPRHRPEHHVRTLDLRQAAGVGEEHLVRRDPQLAAGLGVRLGIESKEGIEIESQRHDLELRAGCHADLDEFGDGCLADPDQAIAAPGQLSLQPGEHTTLQGTEITPQHVTVKGVNDDRARPAQQRGRPSQEPGLGGVSVDDGRAVRADHAHQRDQRPEIANWTNFRSEWIEPAYA